MKTLTLLFLTTLATASAQYTMDWSTMDGGGGRGTAGTFAMEGTLGQPDAFSGKPGSFTLDGGYWSLLDEPLPYLRIFLVRDNIVLAWPDPSPGFVLEASANLVFPTWTELSIAPVLVDGEKQVTWGPPSGQRHFFRLHRP